MTQFDNTIIKGQEQNCTDTKVKKKESRRHSGTASHTWNVRCLWWCKMALHNRHRKRSFAHCCSHSKAAKGSDFGRASLNKLSACSLDLIHIHGSRRGLRTSWTPTLEVACAHDLTREFLLPSCCCLIKMCMEAQINFLLLLGSILTSLPLWWRLPTADPPPWKKRTCLSYHQLISISALNRHCQNHPLENCSSKAHGYTTMYGTACLCKGSSP